MTYLSPFRLISEEDAHGWHADIQTVNGIAWDYVKLHEIVGVVDVGLERPYSLVVGFDGALALPPIGKLRQSLEVTEYFNRIFASLLIGGLYCEAISFDNLETGWILDWQYIRSSQTGKGLSNTFHQLIRMKMAPPLLGIQLYDPQIINFRTFSEAAETGMRVLKQIPELGAEFLLKGATGIARNDPGSALTNLWIIIEQITENLWRREVINRDDAGQIQGRKKQLEDNRTWTASTKQELLYQTGIIESNTLRLLFQARRARNDLIHSGKHPTTEDARSAYQAVLDLLRSTLQEADLPIFKINLSDHTISDPLRPKSSEIINPLFWMEIPKLPGELELETSEHSANDPDRRYPRHLDGKIPESSTQQTNPDETD